MGTPTHRRHEHRPPEHRPDPDHPTQLAPAARRQHRRFPVPRARIPGAVGAVGRAVILLIRIAGMNRFLLKTAQTFFILALLSARARAGESSSETSVFKDKSLEKAVRKFVFAKRDNDKPVLEADVVNLSTIQGVGMEITDLSGLEKCVNLA